MKIIFGDITQLDVDVLVNPAQPSLCPGGGFSDLIFKKAGLGLRQATENLGPIQPGSSVVTPGFDLKSKYVIHAVAPRNQISSSESVRILERTYESVMQNFFELGNVQSIAFPPLTGAYTWSVEVATDIAINTLAKYENVDICFCTFERIIERVYRNKLGCLDDFRKFRRRAN